MTGLWTDLNEVQHEKTLYNLTLACGTHVSQLLYRLQAEKRKHRKLVWAKRHSHSNNTSYFVTNVLTYLCLGLTLCYHLTNKTYRKAASIHSKLQLVKGNLRAGGDGVVIWHSPRLTKLTHSRTAAKTPDVTSGWRLVKKGDIVKTTERQLCSFNESKMFTCPTSRSLFTLNHCCFGFACDQQRPLPGCRGLARLAKSWQPGREEFILPFEETAPISLIGF